MLELWQGAFTQMRMLSPTHARMNRQTMPACFARPSAEIAPVYARSISSAYVTRLHLEPDLPRVRAVSERTS
eukprot:4988632-Pleurochrysis_carterae.AAC.2